MSRTSSAGGRLWFREYFEDHPLYRQKAKESFAGTGVTRDKPKVYCKMCLARKVQEMQVSDQQEVENGTRQEARSQEAIVLARK